MNNQLALPSAGNSWYIENIHFSGLSPTVWADPEETRICHYVRSASVTLWGQLQSLFEARAKTTRCIHPTIVYGDPGSGKSSLIYGWAEWKFVEGEKAVWINQAFHGYTCTDFTNGKNFHVEFGSENDLKNLIIEKKYTLIILDGVRRGETGREIEWWVLSLYKKVPVGTVIVFCTSMQSVRVKLERYSEFYMRQFFLNSWDVSDIKAARDLAVDRNEPILPPEIVANTEAFYNRLYFSGSSIRFIGRPIEEFRESLDNALNSATFDDFGMAFLHMQKSDDFNILLRHVSNQDVVSFISPYVQYIMETKIELNDVLRARSLASNNNSFQGWIHEIAKRVVFRTAHRRKKPVVLKRVPPMSITSKRERIISVNEIQDYNELYFRLNNTIAEAHTTLFFPTKCNQGCFDFVEVSRPSSEHYNVTFYQMTVSTEHDLDFVYAGRFLAKLFPRKLTKEMQLRSGAKRPSADVPTVSKKTRSISQHAPLLEAQAGISAMSLSMSTPAQVLVTKPTAEPPDDMVTKLPAEPGTIARPPVAEAGVKFQAPEQPLSPEPDSPLPAAGATTVRAELDHNINTTIRVHVYYIIEPTINADFNLRGCSFYDETSVAIFDKYFSTGKVRVGTLEPYTEVKC